MPQLPHYMSCVKAPCCILEKREEAARLFLKKYLVPLRFSVARNLANTQKTLLYNPFNFCFAFFNFIPTLTFWRNPMLSSYNLEKRREKSYLVWKKVALEEEYEYKRELNLFPNIWKETQEHDVKKTFLRDLIWWKTTSRNSNKIEKKDERIYDEK